MEPPRIVVTTSCCSLLLIYRPQKDERLSWRSWLTYSGRFTHISGHPSAVGRAQDGESSPVKDQRSTAEPRNQPVCAVCQHKKYLQILGSPNISGAPRLCPPSSIGCDPTAERDPEKAIGLLH